MASKIVPCPSCHARNRLSPSPGKKPVCGRCQQPLPWLVDADDRSFESELAGSLPVLVDFWAAWCGPCRTLAPTLEALAVENAGKLKVVKVDADANPATAGRFRVQSLPTLILFKGGEAVETLLGAQPRSALAAFLRPHLAS